MTFHRIALNKVSPSSMEAKDVIFENSHGSSQAPFEFKRVTHKEGWMAILPSQETYNMTFENAERQDNISFVATVYQFEGDSYIDLCVRATMPDKFSVLSSTNDHPEETDGVDPLTDPFGSWHYTGDRVCVLVTERTQAVSRKKRTVASALVDRPFTFKSIKCAYTDCIIPPPPEDLPGTPDVVYMWSAIATWPGEVKPVTGDDVITPEGKWVIIDEQPPVLESLTVTYGLEFNNTPGMTFTLEAKHIIVYGRLVAGWSDNPLTLASVSIILSGTAQTPDVDQGDGPRLGSRFMAIYGGLDLFGKDPGLTWTRLASTAQAGTRQVTLTEAVDWKTSDKIVITSTSYNPHHTEEASISAVSADKLTLTLRDPLQHDHTAFSETLSGGKTYSISAEVGLLSRNIKLIGKSYDTMLTDAFGGRLLFGTTTQNEGEISFSGVGKLSNVMFEYMGQEGYYDPYDPRFAVSYIGVRNDDTRQSFVKKCSFYKSFSPAIGVFDINDFVIEENVIYETVSSGIIVSGARISLRKNLVILSLWRGSYLGRQEKNNIEYHGGIDGMAAEDLSLVDNVVAGSERVGFRVKGQPCTGATQSWTGNMAHSCLTGIAFFPDDGDPFGGCVLLSGFTATRCLDNGVYYNSPGTLKVADFTSIENGIGVFAIVIGPGALGHVASDKFVEVRDSFFVGQTSDFDCNLMVKHDDVNTKLSVPARSDVHGEEINMVGIVFSNFHGGGNEAPRKPWYGIMSYNAIAGYMRLLNNHFAHFATGCRSVNNYAISTNKFNDDLQHPVYIQNSVLEDVPKNNRIYMHKPNEGKINPSDCVDMDCDALKKALIKDLDGTLLGSPGAVTSKAEFEWDGDPSRGVGDYRIPKTMLTDANGNRLDVDVVAPNKGIIRNDQCEFNDVWNAWECHDLDYEMLVIESMDSDTETRRLSPVGVLGEGYIDLINGPQDHGWCSGYTCAKRISTFFSVVAMGKNYLVHFTGTSPQKLRLRLLNADEDQGVRVGIYFIQAYRLDVYVDGVHIMANNAERAGNQIVFDTKMTRGQCLPDVQTDDIGQNCIIQGENVLFVVVKGSTHVDIITVPQVRLSMTFPAATVSNDDFFGEQLVQNLMLFLGVPVDKVRIVEIVQANSGNRKKRAANGEVTYVIEVGSGPGSDPDDTPQAELQQYAQEIINGVTLGTMDLSPGVPPSQVAINEACASVGSPEWEQASVEEEAVVLSKAGQMTFYQTPVPGKEGQEFLVPIRLRVYDEAGVPLIGLGSSSDPWIVEATLITGAGSHSSAELGGTTRVPFSGGFANFTDLYISHIGSDYTINLTVVSPANANFSETTDSLTIPKRDLSLHIAEMTTSPLMDMALNVTLELHDSDTRQALSNITWRGHTWTVSVAMVNSDHSALLQGTKTTTFDPVTGHAEFHDLHITEVGRYFITFHVTSSPADYDFSFEGFIHVRKIAPGTIPNAKRSTCQLKFDIAYDHVESPRFAAEVARDWEIRTKASDVIVIDVTANPGSVLVTLVLEGSPGAVASVITDMCKEVDDGRTYTYNGQSVMLSPYMRVDGRNYYGVACGPVPPPDKGLHPGVIAAIVLAAVLLVALIIGIIVWRCVIVPKTKTYDTNKDLRYLGNGRTPYTIEDYLFRDKATMAIKTQAPHAMAPAATREVTREGTTFSLSVESSLDMYDERPVSAGSSSTRKMPLPSD